MKWFRDFLKLRKRYDSIKLALILFLFTACFLADGTVRLVGYIKYLHCPPTYILEAYSTSAALDDGIQQLRNTENVVSASFQRDYIVTTETDKVLVVSELSGEYLMACYGIESSESSQKIWLNTVAFEAFLGDAAQSSKRISYTVNGEKRSAEFIKCKALDSDIPFAVSIGSTSSLEGASTVRVMFENLDVSGNHIRHIENLGYTITNRDDVVTQAHRTELLFADIKCDIIAVILSFVGGCAFVTVYKRTNQPYDGSNSTETLSGNS